MLTWISQNFIFIAYPNQKLFRKTFGGWFDPHPGIRRVKTRHGPWGFLFSIINAFYSVHHFIKKMNSTLIYVFQDSTSLIAIYPSHGQVRGGGLDATLNRFFSNISLEWEEFLQTKFLAIASFLGHLSIKNFSARTYHIGSEITQREDVGGWGVGNHSHGLFLPVLLTMKMTFNPNKFW